MHKKFYALGRLKTGVMNKLEARYQLQLEYEKQNGNVLWYRFEGLKFRLADKTFYTPDFAVMNSLGHMEMHEVKGFWQDDARVKIKCAAEIYPFKFLAVTLKKGMWKLEEF